MEENQENQPENQENQPENQENQPENQENQNEWFPEEEEINLISYQEWEKERKEEKGLRSFQRLDNGSIDEYRAVEDFFAEQDGNLLYYHNKFYQYVDNRFWRPMEEILIKQRIRDFLGDLAKERLIETIKKHLILLAYEEKGFNRDKNLINLQNGTLNLKTWKLEPHKRDNYLNYYLPQNFNPDSPPPSRWLAFLNEIGLPTKTQLFLQEFFGYCFTYETCDAKCLYLVGDGANGKSILINTFSFLFLSSDPKIPPLTTCLEPKEIFERFSTWLLEGKFLNFATDIETRTTLGDQFKKIVDGSEIKAEEKNQAPYTFRPHAKHIFAGNDLPSTRDRSYGFYRRFRIIRFTKRFTGENDDKYLQIKLKKELHEIFNWTLVGLQRLLKNDFKFTESPEMHTEAEKFMVCTNPVYNYLNEYYPTQKIIDKKEFRDGFYKWCDENQFYKPNERSIGREMGRLGFAPKREMHNKEYIYLYVRLEEGQTELEKQPPGKRKKKK